MGRCSEIMRKCRSIGSTNPPQRCSHRGHRAATRVAAQDHGRLDVLVTGAGVQARGGLDQLHVGTLRACLDVNVVGTWLACREAARPMRLIGYGRSVALASALGLVGAAARSGYATSKGAVVQFSELTGAVLLLTDPQASYITGTVLPVDGGWTSH
ncbi:MAG TPA: SDR family NAD(P)-dependent oxidoreductase [Streptosporangiaceae bacterium]|nr:SDR family NAD(P)-dependent oxidoreductase [Streptosporangiaceae bacterium]